MTDSVEFYNAALRLQATNRQQSNKLDKSVKNAYLQIVTTAFYELITQKNSPLLSEMCALNKINFAAKNFSINAPRRQIFVLETSGDMYCLLYGLDAAFDNLDACAQVYDSAKDTIFGRAKLADDSLDSLTEILASIDKKLEKFSPQINSAEKIVRGEDEKILLQDLNSIAKNRTSDDEKIIAEIKKVQSSMQDGLKKILEIRDGLDFRTLSEPINQLIQLYRKLDANLKRHPLDDKDKGYKDLLRRCESFSNYIIQSLEMLGVEIIDETGKTFNPDRNKIAGDEKISLNATVAKVNKIGFSYKGQILEKAEVEVAQSSGGFSKWGKF